MLEAIEKLLVLQERDRQILHSRTELEGVAPERAMIQARLAHAQTDLENVRTRARQVESDRKKLELDVEAKKQLIDKYSIQQFQTKKNEEYRALAHEIENCKAAMSKLDDQQIVLMEQLDGLQKETAVAAKTADEFKKHVDSQLAALAQKEENSRKRLTELESGRSDLAGGIEEGVLDKYERLRRNKGGTAIVGVDRSVCGGCHMKLPPQTIVSAQGHQDVVTCPNCGRILYYSRDMDLAFVD